MYFLPTLRLIWKAAPSWTIAHLILLVIQGTLPLAYLYLTKLIIDTITTSLNTAEKSPTIEKLIGLLVIGALVSLVNIISDHVAEVVSTAQAQKITDYTQDLIHAKAIEVDLECYENPQYHDKLERAQEEAPDRPTQILHNLVEVIENGISLIAMMGLLVTFHWGIAGILFVAAIPGLLVRIKYSGIMYRWYRQWTAIERRTDYFSWLLTGDTFAKEIRLFNLGSLFRKRFRRLRHHIYHQTLKVNLRESLASLLAQILAGILMLTAYGLIIYQTVQGAIKLGDLVLYHQAFQRGQNALGGLLSGLSDLYEDNLFLANLYDFLTLKPKIINPSHPLPIPQPIQTGITFHDVSFQYPDTERQALHNINLTIRPGETVALVGENGSGKTTLVKLLCRLYEPTQGKITIDNLNLQDFAVSQLRRHISVIFQDYVKYYLSAQENIWLGNIDIPAQSESIVAAARRSGADAVINSLPQGYDTILGKWFEDGEELSIGQWQKIALARAFLRDSQVIILDEPTSAMDAQAEYEIFQNFRQLIENQAAILITHRLSTVKMADYIYVMENGSIVERGTHGELMNVGGVYARLFNLQARNYRYL